MKYDIDYCGYTIIGADGKIKSLEQATSCLEAAIQVASRIERKVGEEIVTVCHFLNIEKVLIRIDEHKAANGRIRRIIEAEWYRDDNKLQ